MASYPSSVIKQVIQYATTQSGGVVPVYQNGIWYLPSKSGSNLLAASPAAAQQLNALADKYQADLVALRLAQNPPPPVPVPASPRTTGTPAPAAPKLITSGRYAGMTADAAAQQRAMASLHADWDAALRMQAQAPPPPPLPYDPINGPLPLQANYPSAGGRTGGNSKSQTIIPSSSTNKRQSAFNQIFRGRNNTRFAERALGSLFNNDTVKTAAATAAITGTVFNVRSAGGIGQEAATHLLDGFKQGMAGFTQPAREAGSTLLSNLLEPFGKSGGAAQSLIERATDGIGSIFGTAFEGLGSALKTGGKVAGVGLGIAGAAGGAVIGGLLAGPAGILSGAAVGSGLGALGAKALEAVTGLFGDALGAVGKFAGAIGGVLSEGLKAALDIAKDAIQGLLTTSKQLLALSQKSGAPLGSTIAASNLLGAFGVDAGSVEGLGRNSFLQSMRQRAFGITGAPGTEENLRSLRSRFGPMLNAGGIPLMVAQQQLGRLGYSNLQGTLQLPNSVFNRTVAQSNQMQGALGVSPETVKEAAQNLNLLDSAINQFGQLVRTKLAAEALPYATKALEIFTQYLSQHSQDVAGYVKGVAVFFLETLPKAVVGGVGWIAKAAQGFLDTVIGIGHGVAGALRAFEQGQGGIAQIFSALATGIDLAVTSLKTFMGAIAAFGAIAKDAYLLSPMGEADNLHRLVTGQPTLKYEDPRAAYNSAYGSVPQTDIAGALQNFQNSGKIGKFADGLDSALDAVGKNVSPYLKNTADWADSASKSLDANGGVLGVLNQILDVNKDVAKSNNEIARKTPEEAALDAMFRGQRAALADGQRRAAWGATFGG